MSKASIDGYIVVTETVSKGMIRKALGYFKEKIKARAFEESLHKYGNVVMTYNHDDKRVIASGSDIELFEDNIGLRYYAQIDDVEVLAKALKGELQGCSFAFQPLKESEEIVSNERVRVIEKLKLLDVSLLSKEPAYQRCSINVRHVPEDLLMKVYEYQVKTLRCYNSYENRLNQLKNNNLPSL